MSRTMKDSGIEWIGDVPEEWEVHPFKAYYKTTKGLNITKENLVERGIPVISYGQIHSKLNTGTSICDALIRYVPETYLESNPECLSKKYDIFFADTSEDVEGAGNIAFVDTDTPIFAGYHTIIARPQKEVKTKYFAYLAKTDAWRTQIRNSLSGVKVFSISQKLINRVYIILPPLAEQHLIATFLDKKCSEIDSLIDLQEQMIEELKEYKQSVITEAVTKGLNPNVPMKDSGIEWFSLTPINWEIRPLKRLCVNITDGSHFSPNTTDEGKPYITVSDVYNDTIHYETAARISYGDFEVLVNNGCQPPVGAVLLAKDGTVGRTAIVEDNNYVVLSSLGILTPDNFITSKYLKYLLDSNPLQEQMKLAMAGSALKRITINKICKLIGILPSTHEQKEIADFLDTKCAEIDELITIKQQKIESLKEYKKSVIYEYVTGKKEP